MSIVDRLKNHIEKNKLTVPKVSARTGIPAARIYKWLAGEGNPKADDQKTLLDFMNGTSSKQLEDPETDYTRSSVSFAELLKKTMDVITQNQKIIEQNAAILKEHTDLLGKQHGTIDKQADVINSQHGTIDSQQATIHILATGGNGHKKTGS